MTKLTETLEMRTIENETISALLWEGFRHVGNSFFGNIVRALMSEGSANVPKQQTTIIKHLDQFDFLEYKDEGVVLLDVPLVEYHLDRNKLLQSVVFKDSLTKKLNKMQTEIEQQREELYEREELIEDVKRRFSL